MLAASTTTYSAALNDWSLCAGTERDVDHARARTGDSAITGVLIRYGRSGLEGLWGTIDIAPRADGAIYKRIY